MPRSEAVHFLNGKFVDENELVISVRDLGFTRGYAIFDFIVTYNRRLFMMGLHLDRLFRSAELVGLRLPWSKDKIRDWIIETFEKNDDGKEKSVKILVSGGVSRSLIPETAPTLAILVDDRHLPPAEQYEKGIDVMTVRYTRYLPEAKTNNYIEAVKQTQIAQTQNAVEPVYYDDVQVFEGSNSNIFAVIDGGLFTPATNMLPGVTRKVLLDILKLDIPIYVADFSIDKLLTADEVFITGSNKEIVPVTKINGAKVGNGKVGHVTMEATRQFHEFTKSAKW